MSYEAIIKLIIVIKSKVARPGNLVKSFQHPIKNK